MTYNGPTDWQNRWVYMAYGALAMMWPFTWDLAILAGEEKDHNNPHDAAEMMGQP